METTEISQRAGPQHRRGRLARRRLEPRNLPDTEQLFVFLYKLNFTCQCNKAFNQSLALTTARQVLLQNKSEQPVVSKWQGLS